MPFTTSTTTAKEDDPSPSANRRKALREADRGNAQRVLDSYPLARYFDMSERLLDAFQKAVDGRRLDEAYIYGLRFAAFGVEALPKHKDWKLPMYTKDKKRNAMQVDKVISMIEIITQRMDAEELVLQQERKRIMMEEEKRRAEEEERERLAAEEAVEKQRKQLEELRRKEREESVSRKKKTTQESALAKLQAMQKKISAKQQQQPTVTPTIHNIKEEVAEKEATGKPAASSKSSKIPVEKPAVESKRLETETSPKVEVSSKEQGSFVIADSNNNSHAIDPLTTTTETHSESATTPAKSKSTTREEVANTVAITPRSAKEQGTIDMLQKAISAQEQRIDTIETIQIPALLKAAKGHLHGAEPNRKAALKCLKQKKTLLRQADILKTAIFNMETQMFMLENAMESRQVQRALEDASTAMKGLQQSVGTDVDLSDLSSSMPINLLEENLEDDDELLAELQEWLEPEKAKNSKNAQSIVPDDDISILSLPTVPPSTTLDNDISSSEAVPQTNEGSTIGNLLKAVLG